MTHLKPRTVPSANPAWATVMATAVAALVAGCATDPTTSGTASAPAAASPTGAATSTVSGPVALEPGAAPRPAGAASAPAGATAQRPAAPAGPPQPFAEVTRDARRSDGFLPIWTKDDKTWLEIPAERLDQPFFFSSSLASGLGERFFYPGLMGNEAMVVLRRAGNTVQLVARTLHARAPAGTPLARAVAESYSDSLLASAPLAAAPHPERKSVLVDATVLLGGDIPAAQTQLEAAYRLPYALDRANTSIERTSTQAGGTTVTVRAHYAVPKLPAPPVSVPGGPPPNPAALPNPSRSLPDPRSLFLSFAYTLAPLPSQPMAPRHADQRVGYFTQDYIDFGDDTQGDRRAHLVARWRLEKKDPAAALPAEPKEPIRVVLDRNIPEKWREAVRAGVLEWNKAFERAGWRNAIAVEQQPTDADWTTVEGTRVLAVRWFAIDGPGATAVGPSQVDPRTGEILRGAAIIPENWVRFDRAVVTDLEPRLAGADGLELPAWPAGGPFAPRWHLCSYGDEALEQAQFGLQILAERGAIDPKGPDGERFVAEGLKDVVMHEVGHALGLRHNFRASAAVSPAQLRDKSFTATRGVSNSVMDYNAMNLPLEGEPTADYHMPTLGAYDYWAIEYGYRDFPAATEKQELASLARKSETDTGLAYATDEDVRGIDPLVNQRDLGSDPMAFAQRQMKLARELWTRTQARQVAADDDFTLYRRNLQRGLNSVAGVVGMAAKYVGGTYTSRALAGSGQALLIPVPAAQQRGALDLVVGEVFSSASFRFDPKFMSRLGVDQFERTGASPDFSLGAAVLAIQRGALDVLMSEGLAQRLADAEVKVADPKTLVSYAEVQSRLGAAVWSELKTGKASEIDSLRRNLQREHLRRLAAGLLRPASAAAADVRAVNRQQALQLESDLKAAQARAGWSPTARAHLGDSLATLSEALKAPLMKQGV